MIRHTTRLLASAAMAAALATLTTNTAQADPPVLPAAQDIVGVGAAVDQGLFNQLSTDYNAFLTANNNTALPHLYSWDATGYSPITPKAGAATIARPNGSSAGITALNSTTNTTVNFARSTRGPQIGDPPTDDFVAFAKDGVSWAGNASGNAPANLTTADLRNIYTCTVTNWSQITDIPGYTGPNATIDPYLPQIVSDTRAFFLKAIGNGTPINTGACVQASTPQEDEGTDPAFADPNAVTPYSAGHYIGQVYNGHSNGTDAAGYLTLRSTDGINPITATHTLNPVYTTSIYGHILRDVFRDGEWNGTGTNLALKAIFGNTGWICSSATAQNDIAGFGFQPLPHSACGSTTHS